MADNPDQRAVVRDLLVEKFGEKTADDLLTRISEIPEGTSDEQVRLIVENALAELGQVVPSQLVAFKQPLG